MRPKPLGALFAGMLIAMSLTSCGGGDEATDVGSIVENGGDEQVDVGSGTGVTQTGTPTLTAEPGQAWAEVDGERYTYNSAGSLYFICEVNAQGAQVNFQTNDGQDLSITAIPQGDTWQGNLAFKPGGGVEIQFGASLPNDADPLIVGDGALSFEGTGTKITDFDLANGEDVEIALAVNCETPGGGTDPTAVMGEDTYLFPLSGVQSLQCSIEPDRLDIRVDRLSIDNLQLEIGVRQEGGGWIGTVAVYTPEGTFTSPVSGDAPGLSIDGSTVSYEGTFTGGPAGDVEGTVSITCP
jgi:hypothetical protein